MNKNKSAPKMKNTWSAEERAAFAAGVRVRANTMPNKRRQAAKKACRGRVQAA
jgi:hypothetical protein